MSVSKPAVVLVAEDDFLLREIISEQLEASGFAVRACDSGERAWGVIVSAEQVDLLLTDICMCGVLDGWGLAEKCRALLPDLPIIYTSSGPMDDGRQVPRSVFIGKPYRPVDVILAVRQLIAVRDGDPQPLLEA